MAETIIGSGVTKRAGNRIEQQSLPSNVISDAIIKNTPEAERAPGWFKAAVKKVADAWFDPKSFEQNPGLYDKLGVRTFKKYMIPSGDLIYRLVWKRFGAEDLVKPTLDSLKNTERMTRSLEELHLFSFAVFSGALAANLQAGNIDHAVYLGGINVLANIYPILMQRYNRARLCRAIHRMETKKTGITISTPDASH